ncbi:MAG: SDR family oxidoreductase [Ignavibacteria bacterium]|jgi:dTDP-4-dehydrorhamnose reductase|nr:SDR family oxidoreductase [Ignavibacteria bacterium]
MKILILGGSGMLGHRLWMNLSKEHDTWVTVRGSGSELPDIPEFPRERIRPMVDALNFDQVIRALASIQPDLVINCIGLIKQQGHIARDPLISISVNSALPHRISMICRTAKIRMIHVSTDCVFSGNKGNYLETDQSDAEDLYGRTKFLGEVAYPHTVTLRTSIIGRELKTHLGLIEWFLMQQGSINGYKKAIFSGFTTDELSRIIKNHVIPNTELSGLYHVSSDPISKYDLLQLAKVSFKKDIEINPDTEFFCDRSLNSTRFRQAAGYTPPNWASIIDEMASGSEFYDRLGR